jgi:hypothetical protein
MASLAIIYGHQDRHAEAAVLDAEVLELRKCVLGPNHPDTIWSMGKLAATYWDLGRTSEAMTLFEETLELFRAIPGAQSKYTILCATQLMDLYDEVGRNIEAEQLRQQYIPPKKTNSETESDHHKEACVVPANISSLNEKIV